MGKQRSFSPEFKRQVVVPGGRAEFSRPGGGATFLGQVSCAVLNIVGHTSPSVLPTLPVLATPQGG